MRIDAHQHYWIYDPSEYGWIDDSMAALRRDFLPAHLQPELETSGVQGCLAVQARQTREETRWLLELAAESEFILGVIGWVDLRSPQLREDLKALAQEPKLLGVRHIVQSETDEKFLLQPAFLRGIRMLEEFDLAYDILIRDGQLPVAAEFASRFPRQRFVLDHLGKPPIRTGALLPWEARIRELASLPNLACKLSGLVTEADWRSWTPDQLAPYLQVAFDCFGPERLLMGSDWPVCTLAASYSRVVDLLGAFLDRCPAEAREKILGANAQRIYKIGVERP